MLTDGLSNPQRGLRSSWSGAKDVMMDRAGGWWSEQPWFDLSLAVSHSTTPFRQARGPVEIRVGRPNPNLHEVRASMPIPVDYKDSA